MKDHKYAVADDYTIFLRSISNISGKGEPDGTWQFQFKVDAKRRDGGGTHYVKVKDEATQQKWMALLAGTVTCLLCAVYLQDLVKDITPMMCI